MSVQNDFSNALSDAIANKDDTVSISVKDAKKLEKLLSTPRVFIYVEGGVIQSIMADTKVDVMVLDADVEGMDGPEVKTFKDTVYGSLFQAREAWDKVVINKKEVDYFFSQR